MKDFRQLEVWQLAHGLALDVYRLSSTFPSEEKFGLTSQVRRASTSITANLVEGCGRGGDADFARFVQIAFGSACELECHLLLVKDLRFIDESQHVEIQETVVRAKKMLSSLLKALRAENRPLNADRRELTAECRSPE